MSTQEVKVLEKVREYRDYSQELKAAVIAAIEANGGNVMATAKVFNLSRDTVNYWWRNSDRYVELKRPSSLNLADKLENIANCYADSIADHDLSIVAVRDKAAVMDIAIKNAQLLRGQPTSITADIERTDLVVILQQSLGAGLDLGEVVDVEASVTESPHNE